MFQPLENPPTALVLAIDEDPQSLWPLRERAFIEFGGRSLLERQLRLLRDFGFKQYVVVCAPESEAPVEALAGELDIRVLTAPLEEPHSIPSALVNAEPALSHIAAGPILLVQPHVVIWPASLGELLRRWTMRPSGVDGLFLSTTTHQAAYPRYLDLKGERVTAVAEIRSTPRTSGGTAIAGPFLYAQARELCETVGNEWNVGGLDGAYSRGLSRLAYWYDLRHVPCEGESWLIQRPGHLLDAMDAFFEMWATGEEPLPEGYERREAGVYVGRDVHILEGAQIIAPALIGHACVIGPNAIVQASMLESGCTVGPNSTVVHSYFASGVALTGSDISDSVIAKGASLGSGESTRDAARRAGSKADWQALAIGAVARIGAGAIISAGVRLGAGVSIEPDSRITEDVPDAD